MVAVKEHAGHSQTLIDDMKQVSFSRRAQWQNFRDGGFVRGSLRVHMLPSENALNREML